MIQKITVIALFAIALSNCSTKTNPDKEAPSNQIYNTNPSTTKAEVPKKIKTGEPEMSVGLPPDQEAMETAKKEQGIIYLKEGEEQFFKQSKANIKFVQMLEDSRCPKEVNCIWEGVAKAEIQIMGISTRPQTIQLSTSEIASKGYQKSANFNGKNYTLVEVTPETTSDLGFKALKGKYKIGIKIEEGNSTNTVSKNNQTTTK